MFVSNFAADRLPILRLWFNFTYMAMVYAAMAYVPPGVK
jgi:hypothetical protein